MGRLNREKRREKRRDKKKIGAALRRKKAGTKAEKGEGRSKATMTAGKAPSDLLTKASAAQGQAWYGWMQPKGEATLGEAAQRGGSSIQDPLLREEPH